MVEGIRVIAVIGAGTMGPGIAQVCVAYGYRVLLHDASEGAMERATGRIRQGLERQQAKGQLASAADALARLSSAPLGEALHAADCVIEAAAEDVDAKSALFETFGRLCHAEALLASNTSSISITRLGAASGRPENVVGLHFFNPPPVMKLIELVRGLQTSDAAFSRARALAESLEKTPVEALDRPGFISNRILMPFINEAIFALQEGVGTPEAIDTTAKLGFNHPMGPLTLADFIGLDVCLAIMEVLHRELGDPKYRPCPLLRKYVEARWLGRKAGRGFYTYLA